MATYYRLIIPGIQTQHYLFDGDIKVAITEDDQYRAFISGRTEAQVIASGATSITVTDYNTYVDEVEDFARIGGHPPQKPPAA